MSGPGRKISGMTLTAVTEWEADATTAPGSIVELSGVFAYYFSIYNKTVLCF